MGTIPKKATTNENTENLNTPPVTATAPAVVPPTSVIKSPTVQPTL